MRFYFLLALICCALIGRAQLKAEQALPLFSEKYPVEKVYLQYDKEAYLAGDHILFKAYVFSGYTLTELSTNLYAELYNEGGELLDKTILPLRDGVGAGSLLLKKTLAEGVYYVRAYTRFQIPFNEPLLYLHQLPVYNPASLKSLVPGPVQWTARAYPESGSLIAGVRNKVAIRLSSKGSLPPSWSGTVYEKDNPGAPVATFRSINAEVALFQIVPQPQRQYVVALRDAAGNATSLDLPLPATTGVALQTAQDGAFIRCSMVVAGASNRGRKLKLIGQMNNQFVYRATIVPADTFIRASIPVDKLGTGIIHFTLFSEREEPLAERLQFVRAAPMPSVALIPDTVGVGARAYNRWTVGGDSIGFNSLAVIVEDAQVPQRKESLLSSLWLTNDILRAVHNPAWYFEVEDSVRSAALDALLISERWKWFQWKTVLQGDLPRSSAGGENYLSYTGTVFLNKKLQLNKRINLLYLEKDSSLSFQKVMTDSTGTFTVSGLQFKDTVQVYYRLDSKRAASNYIRIEFERLNDFQKLKASLPPSPFVLVDRPLNDTIPQQLRYAIQTLKNETKIADKYRQLEEVQVRSRGQRGLDRLNKRLSSPAFTSINERVFDPANSRFAGTLSILDWARSYIPGWSSLGAYRGSPVSIFLDEMPIDATTAAAISFQDIALVKFTDNSVGVMGGGPALLLYSKRGDPASAFYTGMPSTKIVGYRSVPQPLEIDYRVDQFQSLDRDERQLLLWNTEAGAEEGTPVEVKFFNNDITKAFRITVMGFDTQGRPFFTQKAVAPR